MNARCILALLAESHEAPAWLPVWVSSYPYLTLILVTLLPYIELRGSIPIGILGLGLDPSTVFAVCTLVNIGLIPPVFVLLDFAFEKIFRIPWFHRHIEGKIESIRRSSRSRIERYGLAGLMVFVAVPLPGTGAYSGCLAAYLLDIDRLRATGAVAVGVIVAGISVTLASIGIFSALNSPGVGQAAGLLAIAAIFVGLACWFRRRKTGRL